VGIVLPKADGAEVRIKVADTVGSNVGVLVAVVGGAVTEGIIDMLTEGRMVETPIVGAGVGGKGILVGTDRAVGSLVVTVGGVGIIIVGEAVVDVGRVGAGEIVGEGSDPVEGSAVSTMRVGYNVLEGGRGIGGGIGTSMVSSYRLGTRSNKSVPM
jgi:hypothetical protein